MTKKKLSFILTSVVLMISIVLYLVQSNNMIFQKTSISNQSFDGEQYLTSFQNSGSVELVADKNNVKEIVEEMMLPEEYKWNTKITLTGSGGDIVTDYSYVCKSNLAKSLVHDESGVLLKTVLRTGDTVKVVNGTGASYTAAYSKQYEPSVQTGMADLRFFLETDSRNIQAAKIITYNNQQVLYVEYYFPQIDQTERHYLSLNYGIPLYSESIYQGNTVYKGETVSFSATSISDAEFTG